MEERLVKLAKIVDAGSFTRAARLLHISQPALTAAIQKLERELQAELLIRSSRALVLTEAGKVAYETGKTLMTQTQNLYTKIREASHQKVTISLGMIDSIAELLFSQDGYIRDLEQRTRLSVTVDNSHRLMAQVEQDTLDVAFISSPAHLPLALSCEIVGNEPLLFVAHAQQASTVTEELKKHSITSFLSYNDMSQTAKLIAAHTAAHDIVTQVIFHSTSPEIMLRLVLAKRGSAVLPYQLVRPYLESGDLVALPIGKSPVVSRAIVRVWRSGRIMPAQLVRSSDHVKEQLAALADQANSSR